MQIANLFLTADHKSSPQSRGNSSWPWRTIIQINKAAIPTSLRSLSVTELARAFVIGFWKSFKSHMKSGVFLHVFNDISIYAKVFL